MYGPRVKPLLTVPSPANANANANANADDVSAHRGL